MIPFGMCLLDADSPRKWETLPKKVYNLRTGILELLGKIIQFNYFSFSQQNFLLTLYVL